MPAQTYERQDPGTPPDLAGGSERQLQVDEIVVNIPAARDGDHLPVALMELPDDPGGPFQSGPQVKGMMPHGRGGPLFPYGPPTYSQPFPITQEILQEAKEPGSGIHEFETGAKRGSDHGDCYLHMIPPEALYAYGRAFAEGAAKYGLHNWLKGFPISGLMNHALHHILAYIGGDRSEEHLGHCLWNVGAAIHFEKTRPDLMDLPPYDKKPEDIVVEKPAQ